MRKYHRTYTCTRLHTHFRTAYPFLSQIDVSLYVTHLPLQHIKPFTFQNMHRDQKTSSHYECTYLFLVINILVLNKQFLYPNHRKNTTHKNQNPSHGYAFNLNPIFPPLTRLTQAFPWVCILFEHIRTLLALPTYTLHYIRTHLQTWTHTHTWTHMHTHMCTNSPV